MTRLLSLLPPGWQIGHYARQLRQALPQRFALDAAHPMPVGDLLVPRLFNGDQLLNLNFAVPDRFSEARGVGATIFVKHGDDFVRVTTSVKKENGERAVGTLLDRSHAGYRALLTGHPYIGHAQLFGQQYMTQYDPIRDAGGQLIAVLYVGINITQRPQFGVAARVTLIAVGLMSGLSVLLLWAMGAALRSVNQRTALGDAALALRIADLQWHYAGLALVAVAAAAGLLYWSVKVFVGTPLQQAMRAAQQLAGGDLTTQVHVGRLDEIGRLIQAINGVGQGLAAVVGSVRSSTVRINASADQIANGSDQVLSGASAQADALRQSAASMDNFTATVARNADYARSASQSVGAAAAQAVAGGVVVDRVVETMASIRASAHRIVDIISVIDGIAFQTNILALNASVEAARAGEQGRGFAVVANEVRSLAQRAAAAAKEIKQLITASVEQVDSGGKLVDQAGGAMQQIVASVNDVTRIMEQIVRAGEIQQRDIVEVGGAIGSMAGVTDQTEQLVRQGVDAAQSLRSQALQLSQEVSLFRLAHDRAPATR